MNLRLIFITNRVNFMNKLFVSFEIINNNLLVAFNSNQETIWFYRVVITKILH